MDTTIVEYPFPIVRKACIDVGSNSILLTVEEQVPENKWVQIHEDSCVTALGEGVKQTGLLTEKGMVATLEAVKNFSNQAQLLGAEEVIIGATMAVRIAKNQSEFLQRAEDQQTQMIVLSGDQEAQLGFESVAYDAAFSTLDRISIIDPGGQSTELTTAVRNGEDWKILFRRSFPIGTLALRGGLLSSEKLDSSQLLRGVYELDDIIGLTYLPRQAGTAVVLGATGTNIISIREKMTTWQPDLVHGARLDVEEVSKMAEWLSGMTDNERAAVIGMEKGRERTIHIGCLILERFLFAIREIECKVSVRGWRHALLERGLPHNLSLN